MKMSLSRRSAMRIAAIGTVALMASVSATTLSHAASKTIGVSIPTLDNPFWVRAVDFAESAAKALDIELVVVGAENREDKQLADVQSLIARGVDALVVTPQSTASAPGLIKLAQRSDLPIMIVDRYPGFEANNEHAPYLGFIGPNDVTAGRDIAKALAAKGATKLVGIGGTPGSSVAEGRQQGLEEGAKEAGAEIVQYLAGGESEDDGYAAMQNLLAAHPAGSIDGVWCYNDALCLGAFRAVKQAGRDKEIILGGMDLVPQALDLIEQKTNFVFSTGGHWLQLGFGVMIAYDKINGKDPLKTDIRIDLLGVDGENFATFKKQFIDGPPPYEVKDYTLTNNPEATAQTFPLKVK